MRRRALRRRYGRSAGNYIGESFPAWVRDGARVRIKSTQTTRDYGVSQGSGEKVWPGDIGVIRTRQGNGWWDWEVVFERGDLRPDVRLVLDGDRLEKMARVPAKRAR